MESKNDFSDDDYDYPDTKLDISDINIMVGINLFL